MPVECHKKKTYRCLWNGRTKAGWICLQRCQVKADILRFRESLTIMKQYTGLLYLNSHKAKFCSGEVWSKQQKETTHQIEPTSQDSIQENGNWPTSHHSSAILLAIWTPIDWWQMVNIGSGSDRDSLIMSVQDHAHSLDIEGPSNNCWWSYTIMASEATPLITYRTCTISYVSFLMANHPPTPYFHPESPGNSFKPPTLLDSLSSATLF